MHEAHDKPSASATMSTTNKDPHATLHKLLATLVAVTVLPLHTDGQLLIAPGNPNYNDLPPTIDDIVNPNTVGPQPDSRISVCCPGGAAPAGCTGPRCYPTDCARCNCNAQNLCPLPLPTGTGPGETEGLINGRLRNIVADPDLWYTLKCINQQDFGPSVLGACGGSYNDTRIPNKIKVFINWVDDVGNSLTGQLSPSFPTHLGMARRYGVSDLEIQRMLAFVAPYAGFDKVFAAFGAWLGQYANCSILQPLSTDQAYLSPVSGQPIGVGSPLSGGCPADQCHNSVYEYTGFEVDPYSTTLKVAKQVVDMYKDVGYSPLLTAEFSRAWKLPQLSLKAKFYAILTLESQYRAAPISEMQKLTNIMLANAVTTRSELEGFFDFSSCYTGYTRSQAMMHRVLDQDQSASSGAPSSTEASGTAKGALALGIICLLAIIGMVGFVARQQGIVAPTDSDAIPYVRMGDSDNA